MTTPAPQPPSPCGSKLGLATHEAIVTGKVKIDEMDDLEKADYVRIRRDYLKEGVNLISEQPRQAIIRAEGIAVQANDIHHGRFGWDAFTKRQRRKHRRHVGRHVELGQRHDAEPGAHRRGAGEPRGDEPRHRSQQTDQSERCCL